MFKDKLKQLRVDRNLTQADVAKAIGVSAATIGNYEQGTREPRNNEMWQKLADYFGISVDALMDKENIKSKRIVRIVQSEEIKLIQSYCRFRTEPPIIYKGVDVTELALAEKGVFLISGEDSNIGLEFGVYSGHAMYARNQLLEIIFQIKKISQDEIIKNLSQITTKLEKNVIYWYKRCWNNISDIFQKVIDLGSLYELISVCLILDDTATQEFGFVKLSENFDWLREKLQ